MKIAILIIIVTLACSAPMLSPTFEPPPKNVVLEAFCIHAGMIYVIKSEIIPGSQYWQGSIRTPAHKRAWVEIYKANGFKIVLYKKVNIKIIPAKPETWELDRDDLR